MDRFYDFIIGRVEYFIWLIERNDADHILTVIRNFTGILQDRQCIAENQQVSSSDGTIGDQDTYQLYDDALQFFDFTMWINLLDGEIDRRLLLRNLVVLRRVYVLKLFRINDNNNLSSSQ